MARLTLDHFISAGPDQEKAQYSILAGLQAIRADFARTAIYPHLSDLIELHASLSRLKEQLGEIRGSLPREIESIDLDAQRVVHRDAPEDFGPMGRLADLIDWALPIMRDVIEEGRTIFEFVDSHLKIEEVGILPGYTEEGYLMVPDGTSDELLVFRYALSIVTRANERYRGLKTTVVKRMADRKTTPPQHIKLELAREQPDLPNPATYYVCGDTGYPFEETVMPIAKRKFMRHLYSRGGQA